MVVTYNKGTGEAFQFGTKNVNRNVPVDFMAFVGGNLDNSVFNLLIIELNGC